MSQRYFADHALLPSGWASQVLLEIDATGTLTKVLPDSAPDNAQLLAGPVLPGMPNLHSHAFQRAMAGLAEIGSTQQDSFWSWRESMYGLVDRLTPDQVGVIAQALYIEMLKGGYTQVSEFHYLHHDTSGKAYSDPAEMAWAITGAAERSGIALTLLPVLYAHSGFGGQTPNHGQRRFIHTVPDFLKLLETLKPSFANHPTKALGMAFHSLRAVTLEEMQAVLATNPTGPRHIHVAEQQREVEDSLAHCGQRPVRWLLDNVEVDERWSLIHATHLDDGELRDLAASGAVVGLCPTTEANLGDGLFRAVEYAALGGKLGIGSDSHVSLDIVEELRLLEYGQRLATQQRNCLHDSAIRPVGDWLYRSALAGGAQASGQPIGALEVGKRADMVVLDGSDPYLSTSADDTRLGRWLLGGSKQQIRDVMVAGRWVIQERRHALDDVNRTALTRLFREIG
ncbi:formimidoylglutamate deiminase [Vreelandella boliviensis]|uniref:5-methylthioadenosine/S-adenosylhomocysteine deaminase n=1 Tax=Vreelandella boliviensis LC1 TaxID=1072583 RepID=A0A265DUV1_9GAMM|nr:formimidoylglutamate deiminase [Halomonas boliviensis]EHJ91195.1 5-methylthioadenosine/S-adenosylhomocysteine deaminase [Halomonas boliviensis LC1]OZT73087.1 formimidoylglutamate deiminase [Halomonas boliviensis LC1]